MLQFMPGTAFLEPNEENSRPLTLSSFAATVRMSDVHLYDILACCLS